LSINTQFFNRQQKNLATSGINTTCSICI